MVALVGKRSVASVVRWVLGIANVLVLIGGLVCLGSLIATWAAPDLLSGTFDAARDVDPGLTDQGAGGLAAVMAAGAFACGFTWLVINRLRRIFLSVNEGRAFEAANVGRLRLMGAAMAGLQLTTMAMHALGPTGEGVRFQLDLGAWLGVLVVFMLAEVFRQGSDMREDVQGTV
ncbi:DUF2975 domain-containing protein [Brevundimonas sp. NPDC092305]|uniref:DUF2975 domain-containing protein n=1 Tax=Brevundimonas sp. NPDC092305 TaxID=3363957 RepID=UPI00382F7D6E